MGILISIGRWGGVWVDFTTHGKRISLGWVAFTFYPMDGDKLLFAASNWSHIQQQVADHAVVITHEDGRYVVRPFVGEIVEDGD